MATLADIVKGVQETNDLLSTNVKTQDRVRALMEANMARQAADRMDKLGSSESGKPALVKKIATKSKGLPKGFGAGFAKSLSGGIMGFGISLISSLFAAGSGLLALVTGGLGLAFGSIVNNAAPSPAILTIINTAPI